MKVTKYEIDMLNVASADAFLIHFFDDDTNCEYIVLIDGGNYSDGKKIAKFIRDNYSQDYIDLAICTHCDDDHFCGIQYLLEQQRDNGKDNLNIREIWVNDPAAHIELGQVKWVRKEESKNVKARSVYDCNGDNMLDILDELASNDKITWLEPFSDAEKYKNSPYVNSTWGGLIEVLGPTVEYYEKLVPDFRNELQKKDYITNEDDDAEEVEFVNNKVKCKKLDNAGDDPSSHNQSSVIIRFTPYNGDTYLFMGDAGKDAVNNMPQRIVDSLTKTYWLKVPHHGSIYNMDSDMINQISPKVAYISTEKYGHYLSRDVVKALKRIGTRIYTTNLNGSMCHHRNTPTHKGYTTANPI
jgi:beta-lactamase superfamily II metal-dependent hydrolase